MFLSGKFVFMVLALVGSAGLYFLPTYLEDDTEFNEVVRGRIIKGVSMLFCAALVCTWIFLDPGRITEGKLAYKVSSSEQQVRVVDVEVLNENGKNPVYVLDLSHGYDRVEVPAAVYENFISDGNKMITVRVETAILYVSNSIWEHNFNKSTSYRIERFSFPWEDAVKAFSDRELATFRELLLDKKTFLGKEHFTFEVDKFLIGSCHTNCLDDGAVRISDSSLLS